jgi:hypothetical protein
VKSIGQTVQYFDWSGEVLTGTVLAVDSNLNMIKVMTMGVIKATEWIFADDLTIGEN